MKSIHYLLLLLGIFSLYPLSSQAQESENDDSFILSGKVIDVATLEGIPYSHIKLDDTYWGVICDSLGFFNVRVHPNQSLKVSSMGFAEQIIPITAEVTDGQAFQDVYLEKASYMLEEVDIYSLGTWTQFKHNFVQTKLPEEKNVARDWDFGNLKQFMQAEFAMARPGAGIGISINRKFKDRKQREHVAKLKSKEGKIDLLKVKFNKQVVQDITHATGIRLEALMVYISEREHFTYQTRDYYIQKRVKSLYDEFVLEYTDERNDYALGDSLEILPNHLRFGK